MSAPSLAVGDRPVAKTCPPITRTTLALYCGASGDHNPMHVDLDFARAAGFEDVFAHGMLVMAYLGQALTDAVPPERLRAFSTRFVAITALGDEIRCEGEVVEILEGDRERLARLVLTARDQAGREKLVGEALVAV
ncbi:MaoC/PaaZ C-terminal domain-containing protein [Albimonas pacifica]|uniref:Acyl dehydratase n=1 Tax=Albimonas pacifica TaxID=1114924 RepID=A0A1I3E6B9_9RHOB|nr:MaoC/PaaZ C-terminal domain-containing protein [Albimonas pacifica]SFH94504.1 Acyl dehydratase [Albimonas pacifica]